MGSLKEEKLESASKHYLSNSLPTTVGRKGFLLERNATVLYGSSSSNGSRNKQVRVVNAKPERNCGKSCVCAYCKKHNYQLKKGMKIPAQCRSCGVGVLCAYWLCLSCGGSALKQPNPQAQKKTKESFELVVLQLKSTQLKKLHISLYRLTLCLLLRKPVNFQMPSKTSLQSFAR